MSEGAGPQRILIAAASKPFLPRHIKLREDRARGGAIMLAPERVFNPDPIAAAVLKLCDGERMVSTIADILAKDYEAPAGEILKDVLQMLQDLADKGVVKA